MAFASCVASAVAGTCVSRLGPDQPLERLARLLGRATAREWVTGGLPFGSAIVEAPLTADVRALGSEEV